MVGYMNTLKEFSVDGDTDPAIEGADPVLNPTLPYNKEVHSIRCHRYGPKIHV